MTPKTPADGLKTDGEAAAFGGIPVHRIPSALGVPIPDPDALERLASLLSQRAGALPGSVVRLKKHAVSVEWNGDMGLTKRWDVWVVEDVEVRRGFVVCEWSDYDGARASHPDEITGADSIERAAEHVAGRLAKVRIAAKRFAHKWVNVLAASRCNPTSLGRS